ncbi:C4-dicarboxylic acid transporter DauA [Wenzhouxiangella sp. EGI_FJ10305]|uniref:C4-dicarboxylic acid transporter DauA n=1 Tax=Wenzhouxiangella sp. EGI_FJ10305 TaxID=3243768 RepID=UPI0035DF4E58
MPASNSLRDRLPFTALIDSLRAGYGIDALKRDLMAGLTVGIVAIPLAMALAIAVGVAPQHGLYTSMVAGFLIALTGGSRFNISGPTAAFVVVLMPVVAEHGVGGLLLATMMAGTILLLMGLSGLGRLIRFIPYPVVVGFTAGIAVVIATLQIRDLLGLAATQGGGHFLEQLHGIVVALPSTRPQDLVVGLLTLAILLAWSRLKTAVPAPLVALLVAGVGAWLASRYWPGFDVVTIASRFSYELGESSGRGIPPVLPAFDWPWQLPGADGESLEFNFALLRDLMGPALAIAMLGAIESLLCGVIADGMTGTRHRPNAELVGQGIGNMVAPMFGGITATAAIARTATSVRFGAVSPVAGMVHAIVVLLAMLFFAGGLSLLPMASLAALLLIVAWNMSEAGHFIRIVKTAPRGDVAVLLTCFGLTVVFDMVVAVAVGVGLAAMLFIQRMAELTSTRQVSGTAAGLPSDLPPDMAAFRIRGPMFFGAAERALATLHRLEPEVRSVILDMREVPSMDMSAIVVFQSMLDQLRKGDVALIVTHAEPRIIAKLRRAGIRRTRGQLTFCRNSEQALRIARNWQSNESITTEKD